MICAASLGAHRADREADLPILFIRSRDAPFHSFGNIVEAEMRLVRCCILLLADILAYVTAASNAPQRSFPTRPRRWASQRRIDG